MFNDPFWEHFFFQWGLLSLGWFIVFMMALVHVIALRRARTSLFWQSYLEGWAAPASVCWWLIKRIRR